MKRPITAFAAYCRDGPASAALRQEHLNAHLAYVETMLGKLLVAGPLKDEAGAFTGSLLILDAGSEAEARALLSDDPYCRAGVWDEVRIERFLPVAGSFVGGRNW